MCFSCWIMMYVRMSSDSCKYMIFMPVFVWRPVAFEHLYACIALLVKCCSWLWRYSYDGNSLRQFNDFLFKQCVLWVCVREVVVWWYGQLFLILNIVVFFVDGDGDVCFDADCLGDGYVWTLKKLLFILWVFASLVIFIQLLW